MKAKEKAKEFFDKYYIVCQEYTEEIQCSIQAKECALIAVDEVIIRTRSVDTMPYNCQKIDENTKEYWREVKQEIQAL
jgi:hypothetical protein